MLSTPIYSNPPPCERRPGREDRELTRRLGIGNDLATLDHNHFVYVPMGIDGNRGEDTSKLGSTTRVGSLHIQ